MAIGPKTVFFESQVVAGRPFREGQAILICGRLPANQKFLSQRSLCLCGEFMSLSRGCVDSKIQIMRAALPVILFAKIIWWAVSASSKGNVLVTTGLILPC